MMLKDFGTLHHTFCLSLVLFLALLMLIFKLPNKVYEIIFYSFQIARLTLYIELNLLNI